MDVKLSTPAGPVRNENLPAMGHGDPLANGQTKPDSPTFGAAHSVEFVEDTCFFSSRNAWSAVGNDEFDPLWFHARTDLDWTRRGRVLERILQQVHEELLNQYCIQGHQRQIRG